MAIQITSETVQLPQDVSRLFVNPYDEKAFSQFDPYTGEATYDPLLRNQSYFQALPSVQNSMLFEKVTQNFSYDPKVRVYPDRKPSVQLHHEFVRCWENMQQDERTNSICHRTFWLGESWPDDEINQELVSELLVKGLAERVKRFKKNIGMNELIPYVPEVAQLKPYTYRAGEPYQEWFRKNKGRSRFDWDVVNAFAKGEVVEPILNVYAFGYVTDVLKADEIERVYAELKANPEPKVEISNLENNKDKFDQLTSAVTQLVEIQAKQLTPNKQLKGKTENE